MEGHLDSTSRSPTPEIDLKDALKQLWSQRSLIIKYMLVSLAFGLIFYFGSETIYTSSCKLMPEGIDSQGPSLGAFGSLAGLAGVSLDINANGDIPLSAYPEIVSSLPFQLELVQTPVNFKALNRSMSYYDYYFQVRRRPLLELLREYTIKLPGKIRDLLNDSEDTSGTVNQVEDILTLTKKEMEMMRSFEKMIELTIDEEVGVVTIRAHLPDRMAAAEMTNLVYANITKEVTRHKIEKAQLSLDFIQERYDDARSEYYAQQNRLAQHLDKNQYISKSLTEVATQRLEDEVSVSYEIYKSLASQLEQAKIALQEEMPVFSVLEPPLVPIKPSSPRLSIIFLVFVFIGLLTSSSYVLVRWLLLQS